MALCSHRMSLERSVDQFHKIKYQRTEGVAPWLTQSRETRPAYVGSLC